MFPNSHTVADGFNVRLLMNHHYSELCRVIDEKLLVYERCGMMRLLMTLRYRLTCVQKEHLRIYFAASLGIKSLYEFLYGTVGLFRVRAQNIDSCRRYPDELLNKIDQLRKKPFARCALWARHCIIRGKKWPEYSILPGITASQKVFTVR